MNEMTTIPAAELSGEEQALILHKEIMYNYRMAAAHLVDAAKGLKRMRDTKAYHELGMATFEEYTESMAGIKARQAYTYISALERLGAPMMEEHAALGITKLSLLAEITPMERDEFASENDLAGMTVKEMEVLVAENNRRGEQISLFEQEKEELLAKIEELENKPPERVTVIQPDEDAVREAVDEAIAEAEAGRQEAIDKAVEAALEAVKEKQDKDREKLKKARADAAAAQKEVEDLKAQREKDRQDAEERNVLWEERYEKLSAEKNAAEERAASAGNNAVQAFAIRFENLQRETAALRMLIEEIREGDPGMAEKLSGALQRLLNEMLSQFGGGMDG